MKKALPNTKVTVKLRRSRYKEEWYLIIESYPVYKRGSNRASRLLEENWHFHWLMVESF